MEKEKLTALVKQVQQGNDLAITALYNGYHGNLYYYITRTLDNQSDPDLAADLTQDTFIEILQTIHKLQDPEAFPTWSRRIAYHKCTAYFRKRHELLADEQEDGSTVFDTLVEEREEFIPGEALDKEDLKNTIREMINALPEEQRNAIMMRYFDELSVQQIARIQSTTEGTVKSRLNYGRKSIKNAVETYEKKHNIKLHCAGVIPMLLWLSRAQKHANTAAKLSAMGISPRRAPAKPMQKAAASAKKATTFAARKVVAAVVAATVSVGALGIAASQLTKQEQPAEENTISLTDQASIDKDTQSQMAEISPEDYCGAWTNGAEIITISYSAAAERYYCQYQAEGEVPFAFFADFDPQEGAFLVPEGHACGYEETDAQGNVTVNWQESENPALRFVCEEDEILWYIGESEPQTLFPAESAPAEDSTQPDENIGQDAVQYVLEDYPAYSQKVAEYHSAIFAGGFSEELYPTLNTLMLRYYHQFSEDAWFFYALEDIDGNGTPELLIGKTYSPEGIPEIIDLYSLSGGSIVQYFEDPYFGERTYLRILEGGLLQNGGSSSAASGGCTIYQISEDGGSVYSVAGYGYFFPDENTPPPEGDYMSYEEYRAATSQYQSYPGQIVWVSIDS